MEQLALTPREFGVEIDIRSRGNDLILCHDAGGGGPRLDEWVNHFCHRFIVVNVKEEGLEERVRDVLDGAGVTDWAFLDQSFPYLVKSLAQGESRVMVRVSELECPDTALALNPSPAWVWLDSFSGEWQNAEVLMNLKNAGFRIMVASPELHGRDPSRESAQLRRVLSEAELQVDAVCTRRPELWQ